jgi:hypothetical protein
MFCPECRAEYRPSFTRCADCDLHLVESLPENRDSDVVQADSDLREIWAGENPEECVSICKELKRAGVPFNVFQYRRQLLTALQQNFRIVVPSSFFDQARPIVNKSYLDFNDEPEDQRIMELPAQEGQARIEKVGNDRRRVASENATVEVFVEKAQQRAGMVETCLRENHILFRTEALPNGSRRIIVAPNDEDRAREIVREIRDGSPPK